MSEALSDHLEEQADAAERDWLARSRAVCRIASWNGLACALGCLVSTPHFWCRECDWPWLTWQLSGSALQLAVFASILANIRRERAANRVYATLMGLMDRRIRLRFEELGRLMERQERGY